MDHIELKTVRGAMRVERRITNPLKQRAYSYQLLAHSGHTDLRAISLNLTQSGLLPKEGKEREPS